MRRALFPLAPRGLTRTLLSSHQASPGQRWFSDSKLEQLGMKRDKHHFKERLSFKDATIRDILRNKGAKVFTIHENDTVQEAVQLMSAEKIGSLGALHSSA